MPSPRPPVGWAFVALAVLSGAWACRASDGGSCRTLSASRLEGSIHVFIGHRPSPDQERPTWLPQDAACSGCGMGDPVVATVVARAADGRWSAPRPLGLTMVGLPFENRYRTWSLRLADPVDGRALYYVAAPVSGELGLPAHRVQTAEEVTTHAVASLDRWTLAIAEQGVDVGLLLQRLTSEGEDARELSDLGTFGWDASWPSGTRLLGIDGDTTAVAVFGRSPDGESLHVELVPAEQLPRPLPPLLTPRGGLVAALWHAGGPAAFVLHGSGLWLHRFEDGAWRAQPAPASPLPPEALAPGAVLAAAAAGKTRNEAIAVLLAGESLHVRSFRDSRWLPEATVSLARPTSTPAMAAQGALPGAGLAGPGGAPSWLLPAATACAGLLGLGLLLARSRRR